MYMHLLAPGGCTPDPCLKPLFEIPGYAPVYQILNCGLLVMNIFPLI